MKQPNPLPRYGKRVVLRRLAKSDLDHFQAYRTDPDVARYQSWEQMTDTQAQHFLNDAGTDEFLVPGQWYQLGIAERESELLIGDIGLCVNAEETEAEIGFSLNRRYQNQGLGREAVYHAMNVVFEHTPVARIIGITDELNLASIKLMSALGMEQIQRHDTVFRGEPCIELTFSIGRNGLD